MARLAMQPMPMLASQNSLGLYDFNQRRNMATLKEVKARIRSVKSIQKITKSMKLVATTRLKKAEEAFDKNKPSLLRLDEFLLDMKSDAGAEEAAQSKGNHLVVCLTTERGLCGSVNSSVSKAVKRIVEAYKRGKETGNVRYILLGNKAIQALTRDCGDNADWSAKQLGGRAGPTFSDVLPVAERLSAEEFDRCTFVRNKFVNLLTFNTLEVPMLSRSTIQNLQANSFEFDSGIKEDTVKNFHEWYTAVSLFSFLSETHCIEIGQRMTSMDNATKNAGDLIKKLTMQYNRRRQANITTEITEIVSGAAAVEEDL
jgi:F-type H+-transporting ATPase subunit gamma